MYTKSTFVNIINYNIVNKYYNIPHPHFIISNAIIYYCFVISIIIKLLLLFYYRLHV